MCALSVGQLQAVVIREEAEQAATADTMEKRDLPEPGGEGLQVCSGTLGMVPGVAFLCDLLGDLDESLA